jgi:O-antigen ligase
MRASRPIWITTELSLLALAYAAWLASYPLMMFLLPNYEVALGIGLALGTGICLLHILLRPDHLPTHPMVWIYIGAFGFIILLSQLVGNFDGADLRSIIQSAAMIVVLVIAACVGASGLYTRVLPIFAVLLAPVLLMVYIDGDIVWGRLVGRAQPNYWGLISLSCAIAALSLRRKLLKALVLGVAVLILYATSARGSMVGTFAALTTAAAVFFLVNGARKRIVIVSFLCFAMVVGAWAELGFSFISNELFKVNDPYRGIDTGFTGRTEPWTYGLTLAMERPVLGYGYRESEGLFGPALGIDSAHNGYITMMIDTGIIGLLLYLVFIGHSIKIGFSRLRKPLVLCALGYLVGYSVIGLFERYALNAGQPLSILFLISAFYVLTPTSGVRLSAPAATFVPLSPAPAPAVRE